MKELKECPVNIGSKVSIIFETLDINSVNEDRNPLKAKMAIKYLDEPYGKVRLEELKGMEHSVWVQIGENDRVYNIVIEDKNSKIGRPRQLYMGNKQKDYLKKELIRTKSRIETLYK